MSQAGITLFFAVLCPGALELLENLMKERGCVPGRAPTCQRKAGRRNQRARRAPPPCQGKASLPCCFVIQGFGKMFKEDPQSTDVNVKVDG